MAWSVTLWVKPEGPVGSLAGLVGNGDCIEGPSFDVFANPAGVSCSVDTEVSPLTALTEAEVGLLTTHEIYLYSLG